MCHHRLWSTKAHVKERISTRLDYLDKDGTEVKAINPTQEIPEEKHPKKVTVMKEVYFSNCKSEKCSTWQKSI